MRSPIWCAVIDGQLHARSHVGRGQRHQVDDALKHDAAQFHVWHLAVIEQPTHVAIPLSTDANIGVTHRKAKGVVIAMRARVDLQKTSVSVNWGSTHRVTRKQQERAQSFVRQWLGMGLHLDKSYSHR